MPKLPLKVVGEPHRVQVAEDLEPVVSGVADADVADGYIVAGDEHDAKVAGIADRRIRDVAGIPLIEGNAGAADVVDGGARARW